MAGREYEITKDDHTLTAEEIRAAEVTVVAGTDMVHEEPDNLDDPGVKVAKILDQKDSGKSALARLEESRKIIEESGVEIDPNSEAAAAIREETERLFTEMGELNNAERELLFGEDQGAVEANAETGSAINSKVATKVFEDYEAAGGSPEELRKMREQLVQDFIEEIDEQVDRDDAGYFDDKKNGERVKTILVAALKKGVEIQSKDFVDNGGEPAFGYEYRLEGAEFSSSDGEKVSYITDLSLRFGCYRDESGQIVWPDGGKEVELAPLRKHEQADTQRMEKGEESNSRQG